MNVKDYTTDELFAQLGEQLTSQRRFLKAIDDQLGEAIFEARDRNSGKAIDILHAIQREIRVKVQ